MIFAPKEKTTDEIIQNCTDVRFLEEELLPCLEKDIESTQKMIEDPIGLQARMSKDSIPAKLKGLKATKQLLLTRIKQLNDQS